MSEINNVSNAYLNTLKNLTSGDGGSKPADVNIGGGSFGDLLKDTVGGAIEAQHVSEQVSAKAITGEASMTDLLAATNDAEMALKSVLAIRDRVIDAYETIMRTPI